MIQKDHASCNSQSDVQILQLWKVSMSPSLWVNHNKKEKRPYLLQKATEELWSQKIGLTQRLQAKEFECSFNKQWWAVYRVKCSCITEEYLESEVNTHPTKS